MTPVVYSAQTLTGALIGTCFCSLVAGFAFGFWFSQRLRGVSYPEPSEQRQQLNRLTESSESPGFNNKSINLVLNVPPKNPNGKNANSSAENKPVQKVKKTYIWYRRRHRAVWGLPQDPAGSGISSSSSSSDLAESDERNDEDGGDDDEDDNGTTPTSLTTGIATDYTSNTHDKRDEDHYKGHYESIVNDETCTLEYIGSHDAQQRSSASGYSRYHRPECAETALTNESTCELRDSGGSDSANSFNGLCGHRPIARIVDDDRFERHEATNNVRNHYMIPTGDSRELNERILSLFNPQFLPNFNDMITYVATHNSPSPKSQSMTRDNEDDDLLFRNTNYCDLIKRGSTNSMCFRRGLAYEAPRKW